MQTRNPIVAGQFYAGDRDSCVAEIEECLAERSLPKLLPDTIVAGIVPHAGWIFSGALAAMVFAAVRKRHERVDTFVIFGAAHAYYGSAPVVYDRGSWRTPLGEAQVDDELAAAIVDTGMAVGDPGAHKTEHSIEVQVPIVQYLFPGAAMVPVIVPPAGEAVSLGQAVGRVIGETGKKVVCIGSTDLTHYGPRYGFAPMGAGAEALKWVDAVNDKAFIDLALKLDAEGILASAADNRNACGPGAAAAAIAAARQLGKTEGLLLARANSNDAMKSKMGRTGSNTVGYAAIVF